eukprot:TRINITY_DN12333_c8_g1_i2.p1 TRINITY_DN12333_c8_g1~~TRINITY_DN12333_c8_g1_i2.p1  ORF type:complete len:806 (+),score=159.43 TRINITY_DN12333_c8_g1_i2:44-2419(+)
MAIDIAEMKRAPTCINLDTIVEAQRSACDHYRCVICQELPPQPIECKECGAFFGGPCLAIWLVDHPNCPSCRAQLSAESDLHTPRNVRKAISKVQVYCPHKNLGCEEVLEIESVTHHLYNGCKYRVTQCDNAGCSFSCLEADMPAHKLKCDYRLVACTNPGCHRNDLRPSELEDHVLQRCWHTIINCPYGCGAKIKRSEFRMHACSRELVPRLTQLEDHVRTLMAEVRHLRSDNANLVRREAQLLKRTHTQSAKARKLLLKAARKGDRVAAYEYGKDVVGCKEFTLATRHRGLRFLVAAAKAKVADAWFELAMLYPGSQQAEWTEMPSSRDYYFKVLQPALCNVMKVILKDRRPEIRDALKRTPTPWSALESCVSTPLAPEEVIGPTVGIPPEVLEDETIISAPGNVLDQSSEPADVDSLNLTTGSDGSLSERSRPETEVMVSQNTNQPSSVPKGDPAAKKAKLDTANTEQQVLPRHIAHAFLVTQQGLAYESDTQDACDLDKQLKILFLACAAQLDVKHVRAFAHCIKSEHVPKPVYRRLLQLAAKHGDVDADEELCDTKDQHNFTHRVLYPSGHVQHALRNVELTVNENEPYLRELADEGLPAAATITAASIVFLNPGNTEEAFFYAERAASSGDVAGYALLAECMLKRSGPVTEDIKTRARQWADKGKDDVRYGAYVWGKVLACGIGGERDYTQAAEAFERVDNPVLVRRCRARKEAARSARFLDYDTDEDDDLAEMAQRDVEESTGHNDMESELDGAHDPYHDPYNSDLTNDEMISDENSSVNARSW